MNLDNYRKETLLKKHLTNSKEKEEIIKIKRYKYILILVKIWIIYNNNMKSYTGKIFIIIEKY